MIKMNNNGTTFTLPITLTLTQQEIDSLPKNGVMVEEAVLIKLYTQIRNEGIVGLRDRVNNLHPQYTTFRNHCDELVEDDDE